MSEQPAKEVAWTAPILRELLRSGVLFTEAAGNGTLGTCPGFPDCPYTVPHLHYVFPDDRGGRVTVYDGG